MNIAKRILAGVLIGLALTTAPLFAAHAGVEVPAREFIAAMADDAADALTASGIMRQERIRRFRRLFNDRFAVKTIGKWVLGRYWRKATADERREYLNLFEDLIVVSYVDSFAKFVGKTLNITHARPHGETGATVSTEIARPRGGPPVRIDWRVGSKREVFKVVDIVVEGASMSATLRSEFGSIVRRQGGSVGGLISVLRTKTASLQQASRN